MIKDELFKKLVELTLVPSFRKPTFDELWNLIPATIENDKYQLFIQKGGYTRIFYRNSNSRFLKHVKHNDRCDKSLSDLAAEMLIELKQRGLLND